MISETKALPLNPDSPITAITVTFNHKKVIGEWVEAMLASPPGVAAIVIVDNGSTDGSAGFLEGHYPDQVAVVRNTVNEGLESALNQALDRVKTPYTAIAGPDVVVDQNGLLPLLKALEIDPNAIFSSSKIHFFDKPNLIQSAGADLSFTGHITLRRRFAVEDRSPEEISEINVCDSSSMMMRTEAFRSLGGFDADLFVYFDEFDWCVRARAAGHKILYIPESTAIHKHGTEGVSYRGKGKYPPIRWFHMEKNRLYVILKTYQLRTVLILAPALLIFEISSFAFACLHGLALTHLKARWWNLTRLPMTLKKRRKVQQHRKVGDREILSAPPLSPHTELTKSPLIALSKGLIERFLAAYWTIARPLI